MKTCDVIVIGGGSAAFEAAVAASENGADKIVMLEKAPESEYGGNARYSGTGFRFWHRGLTKFARSSPRSQMTISRACKLPLTRRRTFFPTLNG